MEDLTIKQLITKLSELLNLPNSDIRIKKLFKIESCLIETKKLTEKSSNITVSEKINYAKIPAIEKFLTKTLISIINCSDPALAFEFYESHTDLNLIQNHKAELPIVHQINLLFNSVKLQAKKLNIEKDIEYISKYATNKNQKYLSKLNKTINFIEDTNEYITKIGNYSNDEESFITFINQQTFLNELKDRFINILDVIKKQDNIIPSYLEFLESENLLVVDNEIILERDVLKRLSNIEKITNFKLATHEETKQYILENNPEITEEEIDRELQRLRIFDQINKDYLKATISYLTNILGEKDKYFMKNIFEIIDYLEETRQIYLNSSKSNKIDKNTLENINILENHLSNILMYIANTPNPKVNLAFLYKIGYLTIKKEIKEEKNVNERIDLLKTKIQCDRDSLLLYPNDYITNLILLIATTTSNKEIPGIIKLIEMKQYIEHTKYLIMDQGASEKTRKSNEYDLIMIENKFIELLNDLALSPSKKLDLIKLSKTKIISVTKTEKLNNSIHNRLNILSKKLYADMKLSENEDATNIINTVSNDTRLPNEQKKELLRFIKTRLVNPQPEKQITDRYIQNKLNVHKISRKLSNIENHDGETVISKILKKGISII